MISPADVEAARLRLRWAIHETPCPYSQTLSEITGTRCHVKLENLQMTGSFKERGAATFLSQLSAGEGRRGVAEERANILHIEHDRAFPEAPVGQAEVELTLETSGRDQVDRVLARLASGGYRAEERR